MPVAGYEIGGKKQEAGGGGQGAGWVGWLFARTEAQFVAETASTVLREYKLLWIQIHIAASVILGVRRVK